MDLDYTPFSPSHDSLIIPPKSDFGIKKKDHGFEIHDPKNGDVIPMSTSLLESIYRILHFQETMEAAVRARWSYDSPEEIKREAEEVSKHYGKTEYVNCNITVQSVAPYLFKNARTKIRGVLGRETFCEAESKEFADGVRVVDVDREEYAYFSKEWPTLKNAVNKALAELERPIVFRLLNWNSVSHSCLIVSPINDGEDFIIFEREGAGNYRDFYFRLKKLSEVVSNYSYARPPIKTYQIGGLEKTPDTANDGRIGLLKTKFQNGKHFTLDDFPRPPKDFHGFERLTA